MMPDYMSSLLPPILSDQISVVLHARTPDDMEGPFHQSLPVVAMIPGPTVPLTHAVTPFVSIPVGGLIGTSAWTRVEVMTPFSLLVMMT